MSKEEIIVFGAGGHAKVVLDALKKQAKYQVLAIIDLPKQGQEYCGYKVFASPEAVEGYQGKSFIVAIGDNTVRKRVFDDAVKIGLKPGTVIHPNACIAESSRIGQGTVVMAGVVVNSDARIDDNCIINTNASIDHDCIVGAHTHIAPGVNLAGCVHVGRECFLGIGSKAIPEIIIGDKVIAAAGSVIVKNFGDDISIKGVPARAY